MGRNNRWKNKIQNKDIVSKLKRGRMIDKEGMEALEQMYPNISVSHNDPKWLKSTMSNETKLTRESDFKEKQDIFNKADYLCSYERKDDFGGVFFIEYREINDESLIASLWTWRETKDKKIISPKLCSYTVMKK